MSECFVCGISGEKVRLYDAITKEGIEKICNECAMKEGIPIIKKPTTFQLKESEQKQSFSQRASMQIEINKIEKTRKENIDKQDVSLRDLINKNYLSKTPKMENPQVELVDNFHWVIMRTRRKKHLTQKQLADSIGEAETAIRMAERGILPQDDYRLINKLESSLNVKLRRNPEKSPENLGANKLNGENPEKIEPARIIEFDKEIIENLTIADLKKIKDAKEKENKRNKMQRLMDEVRKKLTKNGEIPEEKDEEIFIN